MIKTQGIFQFTNYCEIGDQKDGATVELIINYKAKTYNIIPAYGNKTFVFEQSSHKWPLWKAVIKGIDQAIDFANKELGL